MVLQFVFNGLVLASITVLGALGINLLYGVKKFANFAHGDMLTLGAYVTLSFVAGGRNLFGAALAAIAFVALSGVTQEVLIYSRLEGRGPVAPLVASVGVALILQNSITAYWGPNFTNYGIVYPDNVVLGGGVLSVNPMRDLLPLAAGFGASVAVLLYLKFTKLGKAMRATADNRDLARVTGVRTRTVYWATWIIAGGLAALGGTVTGIASSVLTPNLGAATILTMFAAVIVGGIGSPNGAILGSILVGLSQSLFFAASLALNVDPRWQIAVPFALLFIVLLLKPTGLVGRPTGGEVRPLRVEIREMIRSIRRGVTSWTSRR